MFVLILPYLSSYYYMCPHTTICVPSYYYMCILVLLYVCPHTTIQSSHHSESKMAGDLAKLVYARVWELVFEALTLVAQGLIH